MAAPKTISPPMAIARAQGDVGMATWMERFGVIGAARTQAIMALMRLGICVLPSSGAQIIMPAIRNRTST